MIIDDVKIALHLFQTDRVREIAQGVQDVHRRRRHVVQDDRAREAKKVDQFQEIAAKSVNYCFDQKLYGSGKHIKT